MSDHVSPMNKGKLLEAITETLRDLTDAVPYGLELDDPNTPEAYLISRAYYTLYSEYLTDADGRYIVPDSLTRDEFAKLITWYDVSRLPETLTDMVTWAQVYRNSCPECEVFDVRGEIPRVHKEGCARHRDELRRYVAQIKSTGGRGKR